jgi:hypothetical protein
MDDGEPDAEPESAWTAPAWCRFGEFGPAVMAEAAAVGGDGCHGPGTPCWAAPPAACPLQRWVFEGSDHSDGGRELLFFESERLVIKDGPTVCRRWVKVEMDGVGKVTSTVTVGVGERMAPFHLSWVTILHSQLPGVALGVSDGPRQVCPWLCKGANKDGRCSGSGHGPPVVDVPDARLTFPSEHAQAVLSVVLCLVAHCLALCHGMVTEKTLEGLHEECERSPTTAHNKFNYPPRLPSAFHRFWYGGGRGSKQVTCALEMIAFSALCNQRPGDVPDGPAVPSKSHGVALGTLRHVDCPVFLIGVHGQGPSRCTRCAHKRDSVRVNADGSRKMNATAGACHGRCQRKRDGSVKAGAGTGHGTGPAGAGVEEGQGEGDGDAMSTSDGTGSASHLDVAEHAGSSGSDDSDRDGTGSGDENPVMDDEAMGSMFLEFGRPWVTKVQTDMEETTKKLDAAKVCAISADPCTCRGLHLTFDQQCLELQLEGTSRLWVLRILHPTPHPQPCNFRPNSRASRSSIGPTQGCRSSVHCSATVPAASSTHMTRTTPSMTTPTAQG